VVNVEHNAVLARRAAALLAPLVPQDVGADGLGDPAASPRLVEAALQLVGRLAPAPLPLYVKHAVKLARAAVQVLLFSGRHIERLPDLLHGERSAAILVQELVNAPLVRAEAKALQLCAVRPGKLLRHGRVLRPGPFRPFP
jgi:hypothetical protein